VEKKKKKKKKNAAAFSSFHLSIFPFSFFYSKTRSPSFPPFSLIIPILESILISLSIGRKWQEKQEKSRQSPTSSICSSFSLDRLLPMLA